MKSQNMVRPMRLFFTAVVTFLFVFFPLAIATTKIAFAGSRVTDAMHIPCGLSVSGDSFVASKECLTLEIIDRAHIKVSFPKDNDAKLLSNVPTNTVKFGDAFSGILTKNSTRDSTWELPATYTDLTVKSSSNSDTNGLDYGNYTERYRTLLQETIKNDFDRGNFYLKLWSIANNSDDKTNRNAIGMNVCTGLNEDKYVYMVKGGEDKKSAVWDCGDYSTGPVSIKLSSSNVTGFGNYNIVFKPSSDGKELRSVFPGPDDIVNKWIECPSGGFALISCESPKDGYTITGKTADDFKNSKVPFLVTAVSAQGKDPIKFTVGAGIDNTDSAADTEGDTVEVKPSCSSSGAGVLNWLFCAIIDSIDNTVDGVTDIVDSMLSLDASTISDNDNLHTLWSYFRNISSLLLIVISLVMIIAQSMGNS